MWNRNECGIENCKLKMKKLLILFFLLLFSVAFYAQHIEIRGVVTDAQYKTPVPYAAVFVEDTQIGIVANNVGEFSFQVPDSLKDSRLMSVGEGYRLTYLSPESLGRALHLELQPQELEQDLVSPLGGAAVKPGKFVSLLNRAALFVMNDWIPLGDAESNRFDFGRIQTFPTYNSIEGVRLRAGIASNSRLSPHFFVKGYLAYGFRDQQFKYRGEAIWSFNKKAYHDEEFPKNNLRLVYEKDLYSPGEVHPRALNDLLLVTYRRSENEATYRNFAEINYEREYKKGLAYTVWMRRARLIPEGELQFENLLGDMILHEHDLHTAEMGLQLRYSLREAYVQQKRKRRPIEMTSPVFFLSHTIGRYDYFGDEKPYHRSEFSAQKRFLLGNAGRIDAVGEVMKVWNAVPFPLLVYPNQRQKHHIENNAFFLNRALEFVADEQYTLRTTFVGDDLLLSKVPLLDRSGIKELFSLRASYGRLSDKNDPEQSSDLYTFPAASYRYGSAPYLEGTIGITNLLGLLRVEYVHRFTYRDHLDALLGKIRVDVTL